MNTRVLSLLVFTLSLFGPFVLIQPVDASTSFSYVATDLKTISCPFGGSFGPLDLTEAGDTVIITGTGFGTHDLNDSIPEVAYISLGGTDHVAYNGQRVDAGGVIGYFGLKSWTDTNITLEVNKGQGGTLGSSITLRTYSSQNDSQGTCISATLASESTIPVATTPALCTVNDYSCQDWNSCLLDGTQARICTKISSCEGGVAMPTTSQSCVYTPPVCSSWIYSDWGTCGADEKQTRTILSSSPISCSGGSPSLSQSCIPTPAGPIITSISPASAYFGQEVDIIGTGFGDRIINGDGQIAEGGAGVFIDGQFQGKGFLVSWTDTKIRIRILDPSLGQYNSTRTGVPVPVVVSIPEQPNSNSFSLQIACDPNSSSCVEAGQNPTSTSSPTSADPTAPVINSISPSAITPGETVISIFGENFGDSYSKYDNQVCFGEYCISSLFLSNYVSKWSDTEIQVRAPSYIGEGGGNISVKAYFPSTKKYDFVKGPSYSVIKTPIIYWYYDNLNQGDSYEFSGKNFGQTQGKIVLNGIEAEILSWSDTDVTFIVPAEASSGLIYIESSGGVKSSPIEVTVIVVKKYSDDEYSPYQWYLESLSIDKAWEITEGSSDVVVAVIDSGVDISHEDLKDSIWQNKSEIANNGVDDDFNGYIDDIYGWNFVLNSNSTDFDTPHGTEVASLIAAKKDNGIGISGVAPGVKIMALNVNNGGSSISVDAANEAIEYAVDNGADIINLSIGGPGGLSAYEATMRYAYEKNVLVVAAVGNGGTDEVGDDLDDSPFSPACVDLKKNAVIGVASIDSENLKSSFSNYGESCVDLSAPGDSLLIAVPHALSTVLGDYSFGSGTSFSAPLVAGIAALIKSKNPDWNIEEIKKVLLDTASSIDYYNPLYTNEMGSGLPNAYLALKASRPEVSYVYNPDAKLILKDTGLTIKVEEPDLKPIEEPGPIENDPSDKGVIKNESLVSDSFPDINGNKNEEAINYLKNQGIVKGYPDGTYKPDNTLNRAELLKIVVLAKYPEPSSDFDLSCFKDVKKGNWYSPYTCFAKENNIVKGYVDGNFKPSQEISYVEALKITLETMGYSPSRQTDPWYQAYLDQASMMLVGLDSLNSGQKITRGEMAQLIMNVMEY